MDGTFQLSTKEIAYKLLKDHDMASLFPLEPSTEHGCDSHHPQHHLYPCLESYKPLIWPAKCSKRVQSSYTHG